MNAFTAPPSIKLSSRDNVRIARTVSQPPRFARHTIAIRDEVAEDVDKALKFAQGGRPPHPGVKRWSNKKG